MLSASVARIVGIDLGSLASFLFLCFASVGAPLPLSFIHAASHSIPAPFLRFGPRAFTSKDLFGGKKGGGGFYLPPLAATRLKVSFHVLLAPPRLPLSSAPSLTQALSSSLKTRSRPMAGKCKRHPHFVCTAGFMRMGLPLPLATASDPRRRCPAGSRTSTGA